MVLKIGVFLGAMSQPIVRKIVPVGHVGNSPTDICDNDPFLLMTSLLLKGFWLIGLFAKLPLQ